MYTCKRVTQVSYKLNIYSQHPDPETALHPLPEIPPPTFQLLLNPNCQQPQLITPHFVLYVKQ